MGELNKKMVKDAYPLPCPDEVQNQLTGSVIFLILNLQSGYWQLPKMKVIELKQLFAQVLGWGFFSSVGCPLAYQELQPHFTSLWIPYCVTSRL